MFDPFSQQGAGELNVLKRHLQSTVLTLLDRNNQPARDSPADGCRSQDDPALSGAAGRCGGKFPRGSDHRLGERGRPNSSTPTDALRKPNGPGCW
ncbi:hypothetical protein ABIF66_006723 [Bradyrhizobium japonicum]